MSKHTPGPWEVDPSNSFEVVTNDRDLVAMTYDREYYGYYESTTDEQKEANARLIAAAPELLEALKVCSAELFAQCADHPRAMLFVKEARAAIAKAEGKTNE